jgi:HSP20 family protein
MEFDLWDELMAMERRLDNLFRPFLGSRGRTWFVELPVGLRQPFLPATDVYETDGNLAVRVELPGMDPAKDVSVTIEEGNLVVRGERKRSEEFKEEDFYRMEASYGTFERRIPLPEGVQDENIKAEYKDGILHIVVPGVRAALEREAKPKAIPIKSDKPAKAA